MKVKHNLSNYIKYFCLFLFLCLNDLLAQVNPNIYKDTLQISSKTISLQKLLFPVDTIISIEINSIKLSGKDFNFNRERQTIYLTDDTYIGSNLVIDYRSIPIKREIVRKNYPQILRDTATKKQITVIKKSQPINLTDEIFGSKIERSGTLTRGFSVGSTKDFTLNSGLRLQLSGQLSDDVEVVAALSDQSSPIQPEGNTRTLQEIDKVFIELKHKNAYATFGDFQYTQKIGYFGIVDKKLQGLTSTAYLNPKNFANVSYASARGKFKSQQINGIDGVQGPYRLTGENNERDIIILAGTEKVFINGEEKVRGENYDYTIDYSTGEIYFTPKVVITSASRIKVDFEYSDRKYERNFFGSFVNSSIIYDKLQVGFSYFREGDDKDLPIDISLSENDRSILARSGNDRLAASKSGIMYVGVDTTGKPAGLYKLRDTLIAGQLVYFYEFSPGSDSAFYNVSFSYVGEGKGDYIKLSIGRFKYVGSKKGNYLPIILLPLPELKQIGNFHLKLFLTKNLNLEGELSISHFDKNRFSSIDDEKNRGKAYYYKIGVDSIPVNVPGLINGNFNLKYLERQTELTYSPLTRINEVEYERNWNLNLVNEPSNELLREAGIDFNQSNLYYKLFYGRLRRGNSFLTDRILTGLNSEIMTGLNLDYSFSNINSNAVVVNSKYQKHSLNIRYDLDVINPFIRLDYENKIDRNLNDTLLLSSFRFIDFITGVHSSGIKYFDVTSAFNFRQDFLPISNQIELEANNFIYQTGLKLKGLSNINSSLDFSFRQKKYSEKFKSLGRLNNQSIAVKYLGRGVFFSRFLLTDLYYEASSQRSAKLERIFLRVPKGTGQYIYKGDLNGNGIADEFEFESTRFEGDYILTTYPTDELFPVIDLKASIRLKLDFRNFSFNKNVQNLLQPISSETYLRVEENSTDPKESNVYFIRLKTFLNKNTTIRGSNLIQQDINLFEYNPNFNVLLRLVERRGFARYSLTDEHRFQQEKMIRLRTKLLKEIANQSELNISKNNLLSSAYIQRNFLIKQISVSNKIFYYPYSNVETGFKVEFARAKDSYPTNPINVNINSQELNISIMYLQRGRINLTFERMEMLANQSLPYIPFELTRGFFIGKNYVWRLAIDYQIAANFQANLHYDGRIQGKNKPIHTATAEVKAYF